MCDNYFPSDKTDYYYYFQIRNIEKAKIIYNECNGTILEDSDNKQILNSILQKASTEYNMSTYRRMFDDFNKYADILMDGEGIDTVDTFNKYVHLLMVVANETIDFTESVAYQNRKEIKDIKIKQNRENIRLTKLWKENLRIPSLIDSDDSVNAFFNNYGVLLICILIIVSFYMAFRETLKVVYSFSNTLDDIIYLVGVCALDVLTIYLIIRSLLSIKLFELIGKRNQVYRRNYDIVNHAFKRTKKKYNFSKLFKWIFDVFKKRYLG